MNQIQKKIITAIVAVLSITGPAWAHVGELSTEVRKQNFSVKRSLALGGYDPVSYFKNGPVEGDKKITFTHKGINYRFASKENLETFKANPEGYEPQYGGWCAWAMYNGGSRTKPDPESFEIIDGKLYVFYKGIFGDTRGLWNEASATTGSGQLIQKAEQNWHGQVGG
ncbi:MAG: YHS domain-containing (seleno)protein [Verrucomicrobiota bacterium]